MKYSKLQGLCKDCLYKCFRVEDIRFTGVNKCKYYEREVQDNGDKFKEKTEQKAKENWQISLKNMDMIVEEDNNIMDLKEMM